MQDSSHNNEGSLEGLEMLLQLGNSAFLEEPRCSWN